MVKTELILDNKYRYFFISYFPIFLLLAALSITLLMIFTELAVNILNIQIAGKISVALFDIAVYLLIIQIPCCLIVNTWYFMKIKKRSDIKEGYLVFFQPWIAGPRFYDKFYKTDESSKILEQVRIRLNKLMNFSLTSH